MFFKIIQFLYTITSFSVLFKLVLFLSSFLVDLFFSVTVKSLSSLHPIPAWCSRSTLILLKWQRHSRGGDLLRSSILDSGRTVDADKWDRSASKSSLTVKPSGNGGFTFSAVINDDITRPHLCYIMYPWILRSFVSWYVHSVARDIGTQASDLWTLIHVAFICTMRFFSFSTCLRSLTASPTYINLFVNDLHSHNVA